MNHIKLSIIIHIFSLITCIPDKIKKGNIFGKVEAIQPLKKEIVEQNVIKKKETNQEPKNKSNDIQKNGIKAMVGGMIINKKLNEQKIISSPAMKQVVKQVMVVKKFEPNTISSSIPKVKVHNISNLNTPIDNSKSKEVTKDFSLNHTKNMKQNKEIETNTNLKAKMTDAIKISRKILVPKVEKKTEIAKKVDMGLYKTGTTKAQVLEGKAKLKPLPSKIKKEIDNPLKKIEDKVDDKQKIDYHKLQKTKDNEVFKVDKDISNEIVSTLNVSEIVRNEEKEVKVLVPKPNQYNLLSLSGSNIKIVPTLETEKSTDTSNHKVVKIEAGIEGLLDHNQTYESQNSENEFTSIDIIWEVGIFKAQMKKEGKGHMIDGIVNLISTANSIIRQFIKIKKGNRKTILLNKDKNCKLDFQGEATYSANVVIVVGIKDFKNKGISNVLGSATVCRTDSVTNHNYIGVFNFNSNNLYSEEMNELDKLNFLLTVVHEFFHVIAFSQKMIENIGPIDPRLTHLKRILDSGSKLFLPKSTHFSQHLIPTELMNEKTSGLEVLSIFTLEFIELTSKIFKTDSSKLPNYYAYESIENYNHFLNYKCESDKPSEYRSVFCSKLDEITRPTFCSGDFMFKSQCNEPLENNCSEVVAQENSFCMDPKQTKVHGFEEFGAESRCFEGGTKSTFCLKFSILENSLMIHVGDQTAVCDGTNSTVSIKYKKNFTINCPDIKRFIEMEKKTRCPNFCHGHGFCSSGKCMCFAGFSPTDNCKSPMQSALTLATFSESISLPNEASK